MTYSEELNRGRSGHFDTLDPALREFRTFSDGLDDGVEMSIVVRLPPGIDEMSIVVRLPPGIEAAALKQKIQTWCNGAKLSFPGSDPSFRSEKNIPPVCNGAKLSFPGSDPPFRSEKNIPPVRALLRAIRAEGGRPRFKLKTGTSDTPSARRGAARRWPTGRAIRRWTTRRTSTLTSGSFGGG